MPVSYHRMADRLERRGEELLRGGGLAGLSAGGVEGAFLRSSEPGTGKRPQNQIPGIGSECGHLHTRLPYQDFTGLGFTSAFTPVAGTSLVGSSFAITTSR